MRAPFQERVVAWVMHCFGWALLMDKRERIQRFFEEAAELAQSCGMSRQTAHDLVDYVWGRPEGDIYQEVGGVMNTLASVCQSQGLDLEGCAETELARCWVKADEIKTKHASKPVLGD